MHLSIMLHHVGQLKKYLHLMAENFLLLLKKLKPFIISKIQVSVKRKELHAHRCKKHPRTCPSIGTKSNEFFFFTIVSLQPFALFFLFLFLSPSFFVSFSFYLSSYYILWFLHNFLHPRVGQVLGVLFSCFPCLFLNLPFLTVRLLVHCSGITSTLMRPES